MSLHASYPQPVPDPRVSIDNDVETAVRQKKRKQQPHQRPAVNSANHQEHGADCQCQGNGQHDPAIPRWERPWFWIGGNINQLLFLTNILLFVANVGLYIVAKETLIYGAKAFVYGKEAFIAGGRKQPYLPSSNPALVVVILENSGNTPARDAIVRTNACVKAGELPDDFSYPGYSKPGEHITKTLIAPKATPQTTVELPDNELGEVFAKTRNLFVWGTVTYSDIFGVVHKSEFCFRYNGFDLNWDNKTIHRTIFGPCDNHNCDDNNCPDKWGDTPCQSASATPKPN
jgi:hypothetical protein